MVSGRNHRRALDLYNMDGSNDIRLFAGPDPWALVFDATDDDLEINGVVGDAGLLAATAGSIVAVVKIDTTASVRTIFSLSDGSAADNYLDLAVDATHHVQASLVTAAAQWTCAANNALTPGVWYAVKLVHNGATPVLYIDGAEEPITFSVSTDKTAWVAALSLLSHGRIGSLFTGGAESQPFGGYLKLVELYTGTATGVPTGAEGTRTLVGKWRADSGSTVGGTPVTITDDSGNSYDGTCAGSLEWASYESGQYIPGAGGVWWDVTESCPVGKLWVWTDQNGKSVNLSEG